MTPVSADAPPPEPPAIEITYDSFHEAARDYKSPDRGRGLAALARDAKVPRSVLYEMQDRASAVSLMTFLRVVGHLKIPRQIAARALATYLLARLEESEHGQIVAAIIRQAAQHDPEGVLRMLDDWLTTEQPMTG